MKELIYNFSTSLDTSKYEFISITNTLTDSLCIPKEIMKLWNISQLFNETIFSKINYTKTPCNETSPFGSSVDLESCENIIYQIINENLPTSFLQQINEKQTFILYNSSIAVRRLCNNESRNYLENPKFNSFSEADFWITIILIPLSVIGLSITILTYCLHSALRTFPGLMVLSMSICLLITYCGFMAIAFSANYKVDCNWIVMITHFALLSCLCWMMFIAADAAMTFSRQKAVINKKDKLKKKFIIALLEVHVIVLIFWGPGVINYACGYQCLGLLSVTYGRIPTCWLSGNLSILYAVTSPTALTLLVSLISLSSSIVGIFRSIRETNKVTRSKVSNNNSNLLLFFSIKLGILTGVTIGMMQLSILFDWKFINLVFSAINSSLGVAIMVLFTCNHRVLNLYRKLIRSGTPAAQRSSTFQS